MFVHDMTYCAQVVPRFDDVRADVEGACACRFGRFGELPEVLERAMFSDRW